MFRFRRGKKDNFDDLMGSKKAESPKKAPGKRK
jgi:hypothetical protein